MKSLLLYMLSLIIKNSEKNKLHSNFYKIGPLAFLPISNNKTSIVYSLYMVKSMI